MQKVIRHNRNNSWMVRWFTCGILTGVLIFSSPVMANVESGLPCGIEDAHCVHHFAGEELDIPLDEAMAGKSVQLRAYQLSGSLKAPMFNKEMQASVKEHSFLLKLPHVKRSVTIGLEYSVRERSGVMRTEPGKVKRVRVYPRTILQPLKQWADDNLLVVQDTTGKLSDFLTRHGIAFTKDMRGQSHGGPKRVVMQVVDDDETFREKSWNEHIVVRFNEQSRGLPHVQHVMNGDASRIDVRMPILQGLEGDPRKQEILMEVFRLALTRVRKESKQRGWYEMTMDPLRMQNTVQQKL